MTTKTYTANGKTQTLREWAVESGISQQLLYNRMQRGKTIEQAMSEPVLNRGRRVAKLRKEQGQPIAPAQTNGALSMTVQVPAGGVNVTVEGQHRIGTVNLTERGFSFRKVNQKQSSVDRLITWDTLTKLMESGLLPISAAA